MSLPDIDISAVKFDIAEAEFTVRKFILSPHLA
jgi:hypothetical protein